MKRALAIMAVLPVLLAAAGCGRSPAEWADTRVGATRPGVGNCVIGPCMPHGSIHPSPDTLWPNPAHPDRAAPTSGYHAGDEVTGFSQFHAQGSGGTPSYGIFLVTPTCGEGESEEELASPLTLLETRPYLFRGRLEREGIGVALAATRHAAVYEFTFPTGKTGRVVLNAERKIGRPDGGEGVWTRREGAVTEGGGFYGYDWCPGTYGCWFHAEEESEGGKTTFRIATSFKSVEKARENFAEVRGKGVAKVSAEAKAAWEEVLGRMRVKGLGKEETRLFYSHLFHAFVQPRDRTGDLAGWEDGEPAWDDQYTLWDTWRTVFPLMALLDPATVAGCVNSFGVRSERSGGPVGSCFCAGREFRTGQGGDESDNVTADAWAKGIAGIDWEKAYAAVRRNAEGRTAGYRERGFVAVGEGASDGYDGRMGAASSTLAFAYNDDCAARLAAGLGKAEDAARYAARAGNWRNVWDAGMADAAGGYRGFCRARTANGRFTATGTRDGVQDPPGSDYPADFYEGSSWEYSFMVPGDVEGLMAAMGGKEAFADRLDYAHENALVDCGNEPGFLMPWLFDFAGRPDLASRWAHAQRRRFAEEGGIPGDDDSGAMGAWYVFATAGLFPVAGQDLYALHAPAARETVIELPQSGRRLKVRTELPLDGSRYGEAYFNGRRLEEPFLRHGQLLQGGKLVFREKAGRKKEAAPETQTVKFDANGGRCPLAEKAFPKGEAYGRLPVALRAGYRFGGWHTAAEGGEAVTETSVAGEEAERTLHAHWEKMSISPGSAARVVPMEGADAVTLRVLAEGAWEAESGAEWIKLKEGECKGDGDGTVTYSVWPNTGAAREGTIRLRGKDGEAEFRVRQAEGDPLWLPVREREFPSEGGRHKQFGVVAAGAWLAESGAGWIEVKQGRGQGSGTAEYAVAVNTGAAREGTIRVRGEGGAADFRVRQAAGDGLWLENTERSFPAGAAEGRKLKVAAEGEWVAESGAAWIAVEEGRGKGSGTVVYGVEANPGAAREGTIRVRGGGTEKEFRVEQAGGPPPP